MEYSILYISTFTIFRSHQTIKLGHLVLIEKIIIQWKDYLSSELDFDFVEFSKLYFHK